MFSVHARSARRRTPALVGAVTAMMLLTGCQGDAGPSATDRPSSSSAPTTAEASASASPSPEPSPASSLGPAANLPVPVKPALADENSKEGLEAFTRYWFDLFSYGYETNDWVPFEAITDPGCGTCSNVSTAVRSVYDAGGWVVGAQSEVVTYGTDFRTNTQGSISSFVEVVQGETRIYSSEGTISGEDPKKDPRVSLTFALYERDHWLMLDFGPPEGTK